MMRQLEVSLAVQAEIDNTWDALEQDDWLRIEEKALELLEADLSAKANLLPLPILSEALPKYIGFEDAEIDNAVFDAAFWVLSRPSFRDTETSSTRQTRLSRRESRDTGTFQYDDSVEDPLLTELDVPVVCSDSPERMSRLQVALAWGRSSSESMNATVVANEDVLSELEIRIPEPPSSPLPSSRPNAVRDDSTPCENMQCHDSNSGKLHDHKFFL